MLETMVEQLGSDTMLPLEEDARPESEKHTPRVLWDHALKSSGSMFPDGMCLCAAAPDAAAFRDLLAVRRGGWV